MTSFKKTLALACMASMLGMGVAVAQTDPAPAAPAAGDTMAAPAGGDAMPMKKPMKHTKKKKMMKKTQKSM